MIVFLSGRGTFLMTFSAADVSASVHVYDINLACAVLIGVGGLHNRAENIIHLLIGSKNFDAFFRHIWIETAISNPLSAKAIAIRDTHAWEIRNFK